MNLEFKECKECASKPGSPILCESCLHNRQVIEAFKRSMKKFKNAYEELAAG